MRSGKLKQFIALQSYTPVKESEYGSEEKTWTTYKEVYAEVKPAGGSFKELGDAEMSLATHAIKIRYNPDVKESNRVYWDSRYFEILAIQDSYEENKMQILATKEVNAL